MATVAYRAADSTPRPGVTGERAPGTLRLLAERRGARTVLTDVYRTAPFHPGPLHYRNGRAEVIVQDVSPGLLPGDRLETDVSVADGAALTVLGQGATRIYPSEHGIAAASRMTLRVSGTGTLWWLPGPLIPFRDARYEACTRAFLDEGSRFALMEVITPGRTAMGERSAFRRLDLRLRIDVGGRARLIERALIDPRERSTAIVGSQGTFACSGTLITIGYPLPVGLVSLGDDVWLGADGGAELTVVRGLARAAEPLRKALLDLLERAARQVEP